METQGGWPTGTASKPTAPATLVRGQAYHNGKVDIVPNAKSQRSVKGGWKPAPPKPPESISKPPPPPPPTSSAGGASSKKST
ncbi:hypothetical protein GCM10022235_82830 [Kribbella ginsengisoli]|uniref:Uncharacterized protein n=1 Tax=Kribbella ginsengisoli TaxID=363865 RepID=A0ABP6Z565_9ACTN